MHRLYANTMPFYVRAWAPGDFGVWGILDPIHHGYWGTNLLGKELAIVKGFINIQQNYLQRIFSELWDFIIFWR
jgi:hypothetical protein